MFLFVMALFPRAARTADANYYPAQSNSHRVTYHWIEMPKPSRWISRFFALLLTQTVGSFVATSLVTGLNRTAVLLVVVPLITALLCTTAYFRAKHSILIVVAGTIATFASIHLLRMSIDAIWFVGPLPPDAVLTGYGVLTIITIACAGSACVLFSSTGVLRKSRWIIVGVMAISLVGLAVVARKSVRELSASSLLHAIVRIEQQGAADPGAMQELSVMLANCGREADAESVSNPIVSSGGDSALPGTRSRPIDVSKFQAFPWRETLTEIANRERLIVIMEAHNAPKHRRWIEQTLSILQSAGFRDYAAEALSESGRSLEQRGYPVSLTGFYVSDPHFGNVLRTAIDLDFDLHAYEASGSNFYQREYEQAANLAKLFSENPKLKLVVHAGYGHVFKTPDDTGQKLMAGHLWKMTGIEPYCIWQTYHSPEEGEARQLAELLDTASEPMMLAPVPSGLSDPQFQFPPGAVDAIVVHPPSFGEPGQRVHSFKAARQRVAGVWNGSEWPVLVGAFKKGESADSIALDQVMLREREKDFVLWVPSDDYEIHIFGLKGRINSTNADGSSTIKTTQEPPRRNSG